MAPASVGFRVHTGWAAAVTVAGKKGSPVIVDRRRIELTDGAPESRFLYHSAEKLPAAEGKAHIERCRKSTWRLAQRALDDIRKSHPVRDAAILLASGRPLPELPAILASHALIHTAEGEFFRQAIVDASAKCSLPLRHVKERDLLQTCAAELKLAPLKLDQLLIDWGRALGPPWSQDQKYAALAAWLALDSG